MDTALLLARLFLAGVFALSSLTKLADPEGSRKAVMGFGVPERFAFAAGIALPVFELALAVFLLPVSSAWWAALGSLILLCGFIAGILYNLKQGRTPDCHCFGKIHSEPIGAATLVRDGAFAIAALFIVLFGVNDAGTSTVAWYQDMSNWERVLTVAALLLVGAVAFQSWFLLQMVRQNGRLLLRLDAIDARLAGVDVPADTTSAAPAPTTDKPGKPVGSVAPSFELKSLQGEYESLDSLLSAGRPAVLVFSSPTCGPCNALMPDIGRWQRDLGDRLTVAVVGQGEPAANRAKSAEHGISHVLLQERNEVSQLFDAKGTPSAVLIDKDGRIGSLVARGADEIRALINDASVAAPVVAPVAQAVGAASTWAATNGSVDVQEVEVDEQPVIERSPAPPIELPDLDGNMVSLADFEGEPTVVLFWRPGCGFCRRMLPELKKWEETRPADAPRLLIVSSESIESNREQELASTTVLDEGFATGRAFGVSGTPSAVLVDEEGRIAGAPAVGSPRVLAMLSGEEFMPEPPAAPRVVLNVGDTAPAISLPGLDGNTVSLSDFPGEQRLVMFWSPGCVFCQRMVDDLKVFEADKPEGAPHLFIVSSGNLEANRAAGLQSTMVVGTDFATGTSYGATGTPSAVLVDADGLVASELMSGARKIYQALGHVTLGCRQCLDECRQQGAGEACRAVCEMSGQCP